MKTFTSFLFALSLVVSARAASPIAEAINLDPENPPLSVSYLPLPAAFGYDASDEYFGTCLTVRGDFAFVGAPSSWWLNLPPQNINDTNPGSVYVYHYSGSTWSIVQALKPGDIDAEIGFGTNIDVSEDGSTLVVASDDGQQSGNLRLRKSGAYVYQLDPATQRYRFVQKLTPPTAAPLDRTGISVSVSDGWIALGAPAKDDDTGSAYLYRQTYAGGAWSFATELRAPDGADGHEFGKQLVIDGPDLCIVAPGIFFGQGSGRIYLYRLAGDSWTADAQFDYPDASSVSRQEFGIRLGLSDGRLLVSTRTNNFLNDKAPLYRFERSGGSWAAGGRLTSDPESVPLSSNDLKTFSVFSSARAVHLAEDLAIVAGHAVKATEPDDQGRVYMVYADSPLNLGEIAIHENGGYTSKLIIGDLLSQLPVPADLKDPIEGAGQFEAAASDGETVLMSFYANLISGGSREVLCAIRPGSSPDPVAAIRAELFYEDADPGEETASAFAYQRRIYNLDNESRYEADFDIENPLDTLYGPANRASAEAADARIRLAYLGATPALAAELENLFLDLAYGRAAAELIISRNILGDIDRKRTTGTPTIPGDLFFLDSEIALVRDAADRSAAALDTYLQLFADDLGVPSTDGLTTGRRLFADHVPTRALAPARDINGVSVNGSEDDLLSGYKDLVLLQEILHQHIQNAARLAALLTAKGTPADEDEVRALIGDVTRVVFEQRLLVDALFPALTPIERDDLSLTELAGGIDEALSDLAALTHNLDGTINLFGYEPDFLLLIRTDSGPPNSFENFRTRLDPSISTTRLARAVTAQNEAIDFYDTYKSRLDTLQAEWDLVVNTSNAGIIPRLRAIVGADPPEVFPADPASAYANPQDNEGSDIQIQFGAVEIARLRIQRNAAEISNLKREITIEHQRRSAERGINADISRLIIDFGNQQATLSQEIGQIEAIQAASESIAEGLAIEKLNPITAYGIAVNAAVQYGAEHDKSLLEADKERLAATQEAAVRDADDAILDNNSEAFIKTRLLEMKTLSIDSQEAALLLRQEVGQLVALIGEKQDLERRLGEARTRVAARYFADPIHRLRTSLDTQVADIRFRETRRWLFFMARALEYRWNTRFVLPSASAPHPSPDSAWDIGDLYKMRNAAELELFYEAMVEFDTTRGDNRDTLIIGDRFSLREDYFGFYEQGYNSSGQLVPLSYDIVKPDGSIETGVSAIDAFRNALRVRRDNSTQIISIEFDTVRRNGFETDANGIETYTGNLFNPDNYIDRIDSVQVIIPGPHTSLSGASNANNAINVEVTYAGTTFMRSPDQSPAPASPDRLADELVAYPARSYVTKNFDFLNADGQIETLSKFVATEGLTQDTTKAVKIAAGVEFDELLADSLANDITTHRIDTFRERAVATTSWKIDLLEFNSSSSNSRLQIDEMDDILLWIRHRSVSRDP